MRWKPRSLRARLLIAVVLVQGTAMALLVPITVQLVDRLTAHLSEQRLEETVPLLTESLAGPLFERDLDTLGRLIQSTVDRYGLADVRVFDTSGQILVESMARGGPGGPVPPGEGEELYLPVLLGGQQVGSLYLLISTERAEAARQQAIVKSLTVFGLQIGGSVIVLALIALLLTRNLGALRRAAGAAEKGDLTVRVPVHGADELAEATDAFNRMLETLQQTVDAQQASESRFRDYAEASADWFWETDAEGRFTYAAIGSSHVRQEDASYYLGRTREELAVDLADTEKWDAYRRRIAAREPIRDFVFQRRAGDGAVDWFRINGAPFYAPDGRFLGYRGTAADVSEQMRMQAKLEASEARFRDYAEASADWFWETDAEGRFTYAAIDTDRLSHEDTSTYLGKTREEMALDLGDTRKWETYHRLMETRQPIRDFVYERRRGDGRAEWLRINGAPYYTADGRFLGYRGTATDVTSQTRMQAELEASETRFRSLVEGSLQGVLINRNWRVLFANQAAADIYGFDQPQELLELPDIGPLLAPEERERLRGFHFDRLAGKELPDRYVHRGLRRDGSTVWILTYHRIVDWDGAPAIQSTLIDVTEQRQAEEELRRSEQKFRQLIESTGLPTFIFVEGPRIEFVNRAAADLYGYESPDDLIRETPGGEALVYPEDRSRIQEYLRARLNGGAVPARYETRGVRRDGRLLWLQNIVTIVDWEGQAASMVISIDVSEHKRREDELRQAQKMEVVGQLTGGVAHDFNNLLTVIMGNLELLRRVQHGNAKIDDLLDSIGRAADRGATLTQRLLAFSRKQALNPMAVDVNALLTGMVDMVRRTLGENIEVMTSLKADLWRAQVDPNQLENAVLNLAINARDAMAQGGTMRIETANARLDDVYALEHQEVTPGAYVLLTVTDTGVGMTPEVLERAFDPFFTTKEVGRGSGLGLSMIYGFINQSGGHIDITSAPGEGTVVRMYLPRVPDEKLDGLALTAPMLPAGRGETIVVVEDDRAVRELARALLSSLGYRTLPAHDAAAALELLERHPDTALLFTDVVLGGGMDGMALAREAQRRVPGIKVLYTSGYTEDALSRQQPEEDQLELLQKPFRIDTLARRVHAVLARV